MAATATTASKIRIPVFKVLASDSRCSKSLRCLHIHDAGRRHECAIWEILADPADVDVIRRNERALGQVMAWLSAEMLSDIVFASH